MSHQSRVPILRYLFMCLGKKNNIKDLTLELEYFFSYFKLIVLPKEVFLFVQITTI